MNCRSKRRQSVREGICPVSAVAALQAGPRLPGAATVAINFTTIDVGLAGVNVFDIRSLLAESEFSPSGVTTQEQQETSCRCCHLTPLDCPKR